MYRRILTPVDGSATSTLGLKHAIGLAKSQRARLRVLNVLDQRLLVPALGGYSEADVEALLTRMKTSGRDAVQDAVALAAKSRVKADSGLVEGRGRLVSDAIVDDAKRWGADLIVMGTHGRRGFNRLLMGSDAERVLLDAPVPVLLVRTGSAKRRATKKSTRRRS
jgi:nucleotide-binding universal stress UspA family protein